MGYRIEYDEIYNRTSMSREGMAVKLPAAFTNDPAYNAANRLTEFNSADIDHDENGNMKEWGSATYTWDEYDQLVAINGTSLDASYKYDALGRRIEKTINGTTTRYLYDGADIILEMNENDAATIYYIRTLNIDEPLARIELDSGGNVTGIRFYLADALGSIIALTDENGDIKTRYNYTPFGEPEVSGDASDNPFMFTGREYDEGTGLYYYRARYYSWELGRFISEDPIGLAGGINMYAYVGNSPLNFVDPLGLDTELQCKTDWGRLFGGYVEIGGGILTFVAGGALVVASVYEAPAAPLAVAHITLGGDMMYAGSKIYIHGSKQVIKAIANCKAVEVLEEIEELKDTEEKCNK